MLHDIRQAQLLQLQQEHDPFGQWAAIPAFLLEDNRKRVLDAKVGLLHLSVRKIWHE